MGKHTEGAGGCETMQTCPSEVTNISPNISQISLQSLTLAHTPSAIFIALVVVCTARLYWCEYVCLYVCVCFRVYARTDTLKRTHIGSYISAQLTIAESVGNMCTVIASRIYWIHDFSVGLVVAAVSRCLL